MTIIYLILGFALAFAGVPLPICILIVFFVMLAYMMQIDDNDSDDCE